MVRGRLLLWSVVLSLLPVSEVWAQLTPDNTLGSENSVVTPIDRLNDRIEGGALRGSNLFHSFQEFNIDEGRGAYFSNPAAVENIFSRVTGGKISNILGTLGVLGNANLFFLNPNGIFFGPKASLDLKGSFMGTSSDRFLFENGWEFSATNPEAPPLLNLNLTPGLQYGTSQAAIASQGNLTVEGDLTLAAANLQLEGQLHAGKNLQLQAKDTVRIRDSVTSPFIASAGEQLSIQGDLGVDISVLKHTESGFFSGGNTLLRSANNINSDARFWSGGNFRIEQLDGNLGSMVSLDDPIIRATGDVSFDSYTGASLHIFAGGSVNVGSVTINGTDTSDFINETVTLSDGTTTVTINGSSQPTLDIRAGTTAVGSPLGVTGSPTPTELVLDSTTATADIIVGSVNVTQPNGLVFLTNQYQPNTVSSGNIEVGTIRTNAQSGGFSGNSGEVIIDSRGDLTLLDSGTIDTSTQNNLAGNIKLLVDGDLKVAEAATIISATFGEGKAGNIEIHSRNLKVADRAFIATSSLGSGNAGNLKIEVVDTVEAISTNNQLSTLQTATTGVGNAGELTIIADKLILREGVQATTSTFGAGDAGDLRIETRRLIVQDGAQVVTNTFGGGQGGNLTVIASDSVELSGIKDGQISGLFASTRGAGDGGDLRIETGRLIVRDGAQVLTVSLAEGDGGNLTVIATESVELIRTPADAQFTTSLSANARGAGDGGDLRIETGKLIVRDGAQIDNVSTREGQGGDITIIATESVELIRTPADAQFANGVFTETFGAGDGGDLKIDTRKLIIRDGAFVSSVAGALRDSFEPGQEDGLKGRAGDITIIATESVELSGTSGNLRSNIKSETESSKNAGNLSIETGKLIVRDGAFVSTSTFAGGNGGNVILKVEDSTTLTGADTGIFASTSEGSTGNGGTIFIDPQTLIIIREGASIAVNSEGEGTGGSIELQADSLTLNSASITAATASNQGGDITLGVTNFSPSPITVLLTPQQVQQVQEEMEVILTSTPGRSSPFPIITKLLPMLLKVLGVTSTSLPMLFLVFPNF